MANDETYVLYLDDDHAADALFVQSLAHSLARAKRARFMVVHGSGGYGVQALERKGIFRQRADGVLPVETTEEHSLVERSIRHANRKITGVMTDAVVASVGIIGSERGLLAVESTGLQAVRTAWVESLIDAGVVPVVASFASEAGTGRTGEVALYRTVAALVKGMSRSATVVFFTKTKLPGVMSGGTPEHEFPLNKVDHQWVGDFTGLSYLLSQGIRVLLTNSTRVADEGGPAGTLLHSST